MIFPVELAFAEHRILLMPEGRPRSYLRCRNEQIHKSFLPLNSCSAFTISNMAASKRPIAALLSCFFKRCEKKLLHEQPPKHSMSLCKSVTYFSFSVGASCHPSFLPCSAAAELTSEVMKVFWWWDSSPSSVREQPAIQFVLFTDVIKKKKSMVVMACLLDWTAPVAWVALR